MPSEKSISNCGLSHMKIGIANILCNEKMYEQALRFYSEAVELCPDPSVFISRSNCHMMLHEYKEALRDARTSIELDPASVEGHLLMIRAAIALGEFNTARRTLFLLKDLTPRNIHVTQELTKVRELFSLIEEADKVFNKEDYATVVKYMDRILERTPSRRIKLRRAECLAMLGQYGLATEVASDILLLDKHNEDALYVLAVCNYYEGRMDQTIKRLQRLLKLSPDFKKAISLLGKAMEMKDKKDRAAKACAVGHIRDGYRLYTEALKIDSKNKMANKETHLCRAAISSKMGKHASAIRDCSLALELDNTCVQAYLMRARTFEILMNYESAVKDYECVCKINSCREYRQMLNDARDAMTYTEKTKGYYQILGLNSKVTAEEIKIAYKKMSLLHHPDRHMTAEPEKREQEEMMFKTIVQAYTVLSDPEKRAAYDRDNYHK